MRIIFSLAIIVCLGLIFLSAPGCKNKSSETALDAELAGLEEEVTAEETAKEATQKPAPAPKMNDDIYVEITARSALILDKYKDDMDQAQKEVDTLYEKFGVTFNEYKAFQAKLTPQHSSELQRKIVDFMQKVAQEYK